MNYNGKHYWSLRYGNHYGHKNLYSTGPRRQRLRNGEDKEIERSRNREKERQAYGPGDGYIQGQIHGETEV